MSAIEELNPAVDDHSLGKRKAEKQEDPQGTPTTTKKKDVDEEHKTKAGDIQPINLNLSATSVEENNDANEEEDAEEEEEEDMASDILQQLIDLFTQERGRPPTDEEVQIWMEQLREAAQDGISIGIDAEGSETEGTEGEDEGSENA
ncbi:hypothetical protein GUITHDRAFT_100327 [Guillardia theta CCMP2712]|uniref:Uncharacterized protein n=1 Tax=Guillardia theta (strain CCMP2712) TaxID=905079 RepID=L1K0J0_GUITC|nr:hypothetical protein GUITHDRAFT_100327 [Guillardia theta CCMP2712]EKX54079.1 hypothetical protein GUITHDRAFT_100327 [Guillardia theta CCMP2712]|eukprot:XP_005841059.1 hypothetical protein GUITHDRAFT_100327 [Guillardia theta CCMP2712]